VGGALPGRWPDNHPWQTRLSIIDKTLRYCVDAGWPPEARTGTQSELATSTKHELIARETLVEGALALLTARTGQCGEGSRCCSAFSHPERAQSRPGETTSRMPRWPTWPDKLKYQERNCDSTTSSPQLSRQTPAARHAEFQSRK
jgi:hypothetical protein